MLAERFRVGEASVNRYVNRARRTGKVEPDPPGGGISACIDPSQAVQAERAAFRKLMKVVPDEKLVFLDESGCNVAFSRRTHRTSIPSSSCGGQ